MVTKSWNKVAAALLATGLTACAPFTQYRTDYSKVCVNPTADQSPACAVYALQQWPAAGGNNYLLGFVEFDDQGQLWDRKQMSAVVGKLEAESSAKELMIVVFVHGWKHSAAPDDANVATFRGILAQLTDAEAQMAREIPGSPRRDIVGVYLGWRGGSVTVPVLKELTFWERKNTAQKVGHGGVTEVLSRLELIKRTKDSIGAGRSATRFVVIGHSFGGAVVHTALAQILESRFVQTTGPAGVQSDVPGFGDLVVMINPAFEAVQFASLSDMANERRSYFETQLPVVAEMTSEADYATRYAFPAGRWFSAFFEDTNVKTRKDPVSGVEVTIDQSDSNVQSVGHFAPYRTHRLYPKREGERALFKAPSTTDSVQQFMLASTSWANDKPGSRIPFGGVVLDRTTNSVGRNPYLLIYVDKDLIRDHNDIDDPRIVDFVKQLILVSAQTPEQARAMRAAPAVPAGK